MEKNGKIKNNITLKKVISPQKYEEYADIIRYDIY